MTLLVHLALALGIVAVAAEPLGKLARAFVGPVVYQHDVPSLGWLLPAAFVLAFLALRLWRFAQGRALATAWTWGACLTLGAVVLARNLTEPQPLAYSQLADAPPAIQTSELLRRIRGQIEQSLKTGGTVPDEAALRTALVDEGREVWPGYVYRGLRRRRFVVRRLADLRGPVERPLPGDLAGTLYVAVAPDQRHYWLTAVVLIDDGGKLTSDMMPSGTGIAILSNSLDD